ncbi:hypothetical protein [Pseudomonas hormoni]
MAQSTALAAGITAATSTDIVVAAGAVVIVGIFSAAAGELAAGVSFGVLQDTPGADNTIASLDNYKRAHVISGPGTFRVKRPAYTGTAFGVFIET